MANRVTIQRTTFVNHPNGEKTFGVRIYDDYDVTYSNLLNEDIFAMEPLDLLRLVRTEVQNSIVDSLFAYIEESQCGIGIDDDWFDHEQIKPILNWFDTK